MVLVAAFMGQSAGAATASGALHGAAAAPAVATHTASTAKMGTIALVHVTHPRSLRAPTSQQQRQVRTLPLLRLNQAKYQPGAAPSVKGAVGKSIPAGGSVFRNFDGVDAIQNRDTAGFNLEPPDEGLGAGNGYVANFVNVTGAVYSDRGFLLAGPFYLNRFFGESDDANTSDPRVFYDQGTKTWIATILEYSFNSDGTQIQESHVDVAASASADPTGAWNVYRIDTTNPGHSGCPCLADYPILGVDQYNVYISTQEFDKTLSSFNGSQIYAVSKQHLLAGRPHANMAFFENLAIAGSPAFHVQPANTYGDAKAEYMMASLDPNGTADHRLGVWAITNRTSVTTGDGVPRLSKRTIASETYAFPPLARTPKGYCESCDAPTSGLVDPDWDAMQETEFINGHLVGALDTGVNVSGDRRERTGVAWFMVEPHVGAAGVRSDTHVVRQGYLAAHGEYLLYPHINLTSNGSMAVTFSMGGRGTFLSAAYSTAVPGGRFHDIRLAAAGTGPDNGFTGTDQYGPVGRWGDYSNGQIVPGSSNKVWLATQYIPNGGTGYSNWGNRIFALSLR